MKSKAIFFDRDGVINERILGGYVRTRDEFHFMPNIEKTLREVKDRGFLAIIVTNQRGVGLGMMSMEELAEIHSLMQTEFMQRCGAKFDDIYVCADANNESGRRKPSPAMLLEAQQKYNIEMSESWMIGDTSSDIEAGNRAGVRTVFLLNEHEAPVKDATYSIDSLLEFVQILDRS